MQVASPAAFHGFSLWRGDDPSARYFPCYAALLPFALSALIYFQTRRSMMQLSWQWAWLCCIPVLANGIAAGISGGYRPTAGFDVTFYLNLVFQCGAVAAL